MTTHVPTPAELKLAQDGKLEEIRVVGSDSLQGKHCPGGLHCTCCRSGCDCGCRDSCQCFHRVLRRVCPIQPGDEMVLGEEWWKDQSGDLHFQSVWTSWGEKLQPAETMPPELARHRYIAGESRPECVDGVWWWIVGLIRKDK